MILYFYIEVWLALASNWAKAHSAFRLKKESSSRAVRDELRRAGGNPVLRGHASREFPSLVKGTCFYLLGEVGGWKKAKGACRLLLKEWTRWWFGGKSSRCRTCSFKDYTLTLHSFLASGASFKLSNFFPPRTYARHCLLFHSIEDFCAGWKQRSVDGHCRVVLYQKQGNGWLKTSPVHWPQS